MATPLFTNKQAARLWAKDQRLQLSKEEWSRRSQTICDEIRSRWLGKVDLIFTFAGVRREPHLEPLGDHFQLAFPKVESEGTMNFYHVPSPSELILGKFNIPEPDDSKHQKVTPTDRSLILVPGLVMDQRGHRIGYGAGFYDRYLLRFPAPPSVGVTFHEFVVETLPAEPHDQTVDFIVTDSGTISCHD